MAEIVRIPKEIVFRKWEPGSIYTEYIVVKNISELPIRISYQLTMAPEFCVPFPRTFKLFTGNTVRIPVTFRPSKMQQHVGGVQFVVEGKAERFVKLIGMLPAISVELETTHVAFEQQSCCRRVDRTVSLYNKTDRDIQLNATVAAPFYIYPSEHTIPAFGAVSLCISFHATEPVEYSEIATLSFHDGGEQCVKFMTLRAIGRTPNHAIFQPSPTNDGEILLDFGDLSVGEIAVQTLTVRSAQPGMVSFEMNRLPETLIPFPYCCQPMGLTSGTVQTKKLGKLCINFNGRYACPRICEKFVVQSGMDQSTYVKCIASVTGPSVISTKKLLDFGEAFVGKAKQMTFLLENTGKSQAIFQFGSDPAASLFNPRPPSGVVLPQRTTSITVTFVTNRPGVFRSTLCCAVLLQGFIKTDVIGTCHSSTITPLILSPYHIQLFEHLLPSHEPPLTQRGPQAVKELVDCGLLLLPRQQEENSVRSESGQSTADELLPLSRASGSNRRLQELVDEENSNTIFSNGITCNKREILFGYAPINGSATKTISIKNNTEETVLLQWNPDARSVFQIVPDTTEIDPLGTMEFSIRFTPAAIGTFFEAHLECHVMFKALLDFGNIRDYQMIPPWMFRVHVAGHSATLELRALLRPKIEIHSELPIILRDISNDVACETMLIRNPTDDTVFFCSGKNTNENLTVCPRFGVLPPGATKLLVVGARIIPKLMFETNLTLLLNDNDELQEIFPVVAYNDPEVRIQFAKDLPFPPTTVGLELQLPFTVCNKSNFPVRVGWIMTECQEKIFEISAKDYLVAASESRACHFTFRPQNLLYYEESLVFRVSPVFAAQPFETHLLRVSGSGAIGHLSLPDTALSLHPVIVRDTLAYTIPVMNLNPFRLVACLTFDIQHPDGTKEFVSNSLASGDRKSESLRTNQCQFDLSGGTHELCNLWITPTQPGTTTIVVSSVPLLPETFQEHRKVLCEILVTAYEPKLQIIDGAGFGSLGHFGKDRLWNLLGLERLNELLEQPVTTNDRMEAILQYRASTIPQISDQCDATSINLGTFIVDETATAKILFYNPGEVPCQWRLTCLEELLLTVSKDLILDQLPEDYQKLRKSKLVRISPRNGTLSPGAGEMLQIVVRNEISGDHVFPLFLTIEKGKIICIHLCFSTISRQDIALTIHRSSLDFGPNAVTDIHPLEKCLEVFNPSDKPVRFRLVPNNSEKLLAVFFYNTDQQTIPPQKLISVPVSFKPQDLASYKETVNIVVEAGKAIPVRLFGHGCSQNDYCEYAKITRASRQIKKALEHGGLSIAESEILQLSTSSIQFECLPMFGLSRKICFLTNHSQRTYRFSWDVVHKHLRVEPQTGLVRPGEKILLTISHHAGNSVFEFTDTLTMEFVDELQRSYYQAWLPKFLANVKERCLNFTITPSNPALNGDIAQDLHAVEALEKLYREASENSTSEHNILQVEEVVHMLRVRPDVQIPPLIKPPEIHGIHLTCSGHVLGQELFRKVYPGQIDNFVLTTSLTSETFTAAPSATYPVDAANLNCATAALVDRVVKSFLQDEVFEKDILEVLKSPVDLYYSDFLGQEDAGDERNHATSQFFTEEPGNDQRPSNAVDESKDDTTIKTHNTAQSYQIHESEDERLDIIAVSPRTFAHRRKDLSINEQKMASPGTFDNISSAEVFQKPEFAQVSDKVIHNFVCSVLCDMENFSVDTFGKPNLLT
ncbi:cilia- and flagella-associated protein 65-like isoform X2 [Paramacrobiotus metropolitanus]|uniref:cilia- and flagella-associated protein 65-like isoform X2 n=1 Tax=Paramacrobiotus metropolitanus TaxID=2943436 RepID=UPI00244626D3|nr:cilia- and flagella-associated protein 65-like isoform X2 [Paramacrobiotus metropolitanus]